jgi:hypothetical protein
MGYTREMEVGIKIGEALCCSAYCPLHSCSINWMEFSLLVMNVAFSSHSPLISMVIKLVSQLFITTELLRAARSETSSRYGSTSELHVL